MVKSGKMRIGKYVVGIFVFLYAVAALAPLVSAQTANAGTDALSLSNLYISPQPIVAGDNVTVEFQLYNSYTYELTSTELQLEGSYPLMNFSPSKSQLVGIMGQGLFNSVGNYFAYTIHVPKSAQAGNYTLDVVATYQTDEQTATGLTQSISSSSIIPITFYVQGVPSIQLNPSPETEITPGESSYVDISALNTGTDLARNASIRILSNNNFTVVGSSSFYLGTVYAGRSASATVDLFTNQTLPGGIHSISGVLAYQTQYGQRETRNVSLSLNVPIEKPNIVVGVGSAQPQYIYAGSNQTLALNIENIGNGEAKNLTISMGSDRYITVGGFSSMFFIGSLAAGASTTRSIFITANKSDTGASYSLPVSLKYEDVDYQEAFSSVQSLGMNIQSSAIMNVTAVNASLAPGSTYAPVTFTIKNIGNVAAQQMTISLQTIYPIAPIGSVAYVNQLDPGRSANVTFYVNVDSNGNPGSFPVTLYEQWSQPNGASSQQYTGSNNYYAPVGGASSSQMGPLSYTAIAIIVVITLIAVAVKTMQKRKTDAVKNAKEAKKK